MFFTIITATYNAAQTLPCLLDSLATQTCRDFELIIQDGASKDDTLALAEAYRAKLPALSVASEPDTGIYDAWNKALPRVRGEWVLFLGADDKLADSQVLEHTRNNLAPTTPSQPFALGVLEQLFSNGILKERTQQDVTTVYKRLPFEMPVPFPALFIQSALCKRFLFDTSLQIAADYDFLCRSWQETTQAIALKYTVTQMLATGISNVPQARLRAFYEERAIQNKYFPPQPLLHRVKLAIKAYLLHIIVLLLGPLAPKVLNTLRKWRGLPPRWNTTPKKKAE